jgi:SP family arabinose:H+ symporter-like MFS transporter/SP family xylose:H+ symportor-like MFS transporter
MGRIFCCPWVYDRRFQRSIYHQPVGKKKALIITGGLVFLAGIGTAFPYNFTMFILCRIAGGIGVGLGSATAPVYIGEISASQVRGKHSVFIR